MRNYAFLFCSSIWFVLQATHYELLKIHNTATPKEIRKAYLGRAKEIHPDRNPDEHATRLFQQLGSAYTVLKDPILRAEYDISLQPEHPQIDIPIEYTRCTCLNLTLLKEWTILLFMPCINMPHARS